MTEMQQMTTEEFVDSQRAERLAAERREVIRSLRDVADFLEQHPDVPFPTYNNLTVFVESKEELAKAARDSGAWDKVHNGDWFSLKKTFSTHLTLDVYANRATVCRRIVRGTKVVPAQPEHVVEEVDWICDEPLLAGAPDGKA